MSFPPPNPPEPPPAAGGTPAPELATPRARSHPITPLIQAAGTLSILVVALAAFGANGLRQLADEVGFGAALLAGLAILVLLLAISVGLHYLGWMRTEYYFDDAGDFRVDSGVLSRKQRRLALSRLQSVDVVRPLLGRVFGMAAVRIEVAGSGDSRIAVEYLTESQATALRAGILARAAGVRHDAGEAPEQVLANVPPRELAVSLLLRSETVMLILLTLVLVAGTVWAEGPAGLLLILFTGGLPVLAVAGEFTRFFNFTVADSPDGLRLRFGLLRTEAQTVPPGRVQAVEFVEPLLWRRRGWVRVRLNVAGQERATDGSQAERVLLPVAPRELAAQIVARVLPGFAMVDGEPVAITLEPPPARAHKRAWLQFNNLAVGAGAQVFVARRGFLTRRTSVIPHERTQSVRVTQGPWQRRLQLASVHVDSTPGPVRIDGLHLDHVRARQVAEEQLARASQARRAGAPSRWLATGDTRHGGDMLAASDPVGEDVAHEGDHNSATHHEPQHDD